MESQRRCTRQGCGRPAATTLTYNYADSTAVLGPLATYAEPHSYDLCLEHAERLTAPRGWEVVRLKLPGLEEMRRSQDDVYALADALQRAERRDADTVDRLSPRRKRERLGGEAAPPPARPGLHLVRDDD